MITCGGKPGVQLHEANHEADCFQAAAAMQTIVPKNWNTVPQ